MSSSSKKIDFIILLFPVMFVKISWPCLWLYVLFKDFMVSYSPLSFSHVSFYILHYHKTFFSDGRYRIMGMGIRGSIATSKASRIVSNMPNWRSGWVTELMNTGMPILILCTWYFAH